LFDTPGDKRRAIGVLLSLASAASIAFIPLPVGTPLIVTTRVIAPTLWFMACVGLAWSYARRAAPPPRNPHVDVQGPTAERAAHTNSFYSSA
jgi:hypothetical protein